jgi:CheY-like chemotaxis protein
LSRGRILVVDDEVDIRESLRDALEDAGYEVLVAADGREALALLVQRPCVVLLDLIMPVMSGGELYTAMKADSRYADIPVLVSTSDPSRAPPGVPIVRKPVVHLDRLIDRVAELC